MNFLDRYNPNVDVFDGVNKALDVPEKHEKAFKAWEMLLSVKKIHDSSFLIIGCILKTVRDDKLYLNLDYDNFSQFLASEELGFSREKAYMCIKTYEYYIEYLELDPEHVGKMNISRLSMMVPILKKIKDKTQAIKTIGELSQLRHGDFVSAIIKKTDRKGKPTCYWSNELNKWFIGYHPDTCHLVNYGDYEKEL